MDLSQLETEINKMKADTLSMYGNKIELTREYIKKEKRLIDRKEKILSEINSKLEGKVKRKKKKILKKYTVKGLIL